MREARYLWVLCAGWWVPGAGCPRRGTCGCWLAGQLPLGKPSPAAGTGLLCAGESSDPPRRQRNAQFRAEGTEKQPRSLSQQGKVPGLEMGPAPTSQSPGSPGELEPSRSPPGSQPPLPFRPRGGWEKGCWSFWCFGAFSSVSFQVSTAVKRKQWVFSSPGACMSCGVGCENLEKSRIQA